MRSNWKVVVALATVSAVAVCVTAASAGTQATTRFAATSLVPRVGTGGPQTGDFTPTGDEAGPMEDEFPGEPEDDEGDEGPEAFNGQLPGGISLSHGSGRGASTASAARAKSNPAFQSGFEGLNLFQQRYARGGNQFTVEPPDQGLCVGNGYVVESVNDVLNVFNESGTSLLPNNTPTNIVSGFPTDVNHAVDLNSFYGYPPAINRATGVRSQFVTDPSCLYDAATQRFFMVVLTLESLPNGAFTTVNHLDIAVTQTSDPTGGWNIYRLDVTNDGTNTGGVNPGPFLGDYPHIGADANGFYVTTNAYPWCCNGFSGAQIYALSKAQLAAGASNVTAVHLDTSGMVNAPSQAGSTQPGFTVWPAQSPGTSSFETANGGTEYFMSSNAADEATHPVTGTGGDYTSSQIVVWTLANTASLNTATPNLSLTNRIVSVNQYAIPPKQHQPGSGSPPTTSVPMGFCTNDTTTPTILGTGCWRLLLTAEPAHNEVISTPDSNDTRMQQVTFANGKLWGALDSAVTVNNENRAGIAYYVVNPASGNLVLQGLLGAAGMDFTYPAIGVTPSGRGVIAFTATGDNMFPSAGYAPIDAKVGAGPWSIVPGGEGQAVTDGFTSYKSQVGNPPRTRWGDYGAAAVDGNSVWIASEYIAHACDYNTWGGRFFTTNPPTMGDNKLGTCAPSPGAAGPRVASGNWSTHIAKFNP